MKTRKVSPSHTPSSALMMVRKVTPSARLHDDLTTQYGTWFLWGGFGHREDPDQPANWSGYGVPPAIGEKRATQRWKHARVIERLIAPTRSLTSRQSASCGERQAQCAPRAGEDAGNCHLRPCRVRKKTTLPRL
jgi:hypothetical protein